MKARPVLFNAEMVRALLDGCKTQTRRALRKQPCSASSNISTEDGINWRTSGTFYFGEPFKCPYGKIGDLLWVRETFALENTHEYHGTHDLPTDSRPIQKHDDPDAGEYCLIPHYRATEPEPHIVPYELPESAPEYDDRTRWTASIFMPRWASRLTLKITDVRVERVQDITEDGAIAEGCGIYSEGEWLNHHECGITRAKRFEDLWNSIDNNWDDNPWVWVIEFEVIRKNIDEVMA